MRPLLFSRFVRLPCFGRLSRSAIGSVSMWPLSFGREVDTIDAREIPDWALDAHQRTTNVLLCYRQNVVVVILVAEDLLVGRGNQHVVVVRSKIW